MYNKVHDTLLFIQEEEDKCAFAYIYTKYIWKGTLRSSKVGFLWAGEWVSQRKGRKRTNSAYLLLGSEF